VQYGLSLPNFGEFFSPRRLADLAREAEAAGWDGFFLWDHVLAWPVPMVDPWIALTAIAMSTQRMRIGPMVTPLPRRRPVKLAREAVSLDHLSQGRLILGVAIGQGTWEWDNLGEEMDLRVRGEMLDEALDLITRLWTGEPVRFEGKHYCFRGGGDAWEPEVGASGLPAAPGSATENSNLGRRNLAAQGAIPSCRALGRHGADV
jgi:alkanesulfonate monooxygenase SsuD/methylene tetrahydromethanopterin reductase-like flavin-dependent oxidoreductase (luciferase family)